MHILDLLNAKTVSDFFTAYNTLSVPTGNFGIPRSNMPQIFEQKIFKKTLLDMGIKMKAERLRIGDIKIVQNGIDKTKVFELMTQIRSHSKHSAFGVIDTKIPDVYISSDKFVIDGTHRQVALYNINKQAYQNYIMVDMPAKQLIELINSNKAKFFRCVQYNAANFNH